jgi:hypothetical protein
MQNRSSQLQHPFIDLEGNPLYLGCKELWTSSLFFDFHVLIPYSQMLKFGKKFIESLNITRLL